MVDRLQRALAIRRPDQAFGLQLHEPLCRNADHLAQQLGGGTLLQKPLQDHHVVGHRGSSSANSGRI